MKGLIICTIIMCLCGTVVYAEPLPLVPQEAKGTTVQTTQETVTKTEETKKQTEDTTSETKAKTAANTTVNTAESTTTQTPIEPRTTESSSLTQSIEASNNKWFISDKTDDHYVKSLATRLEKVQDYKGKAKMGAAHLKAGLKKAGDFGVDSLRAAADAVLGWRY